MQNLLTKFKTYISRSYGVDNLNKFLFVMLIVITIINIFVKHISVTIIYSLIFVLLFWRTFSHNHYSRQIENRKFLAIRKKIAQPFVNFGQYLKDVRTHKYFKCSTCKTKIRIPRNKGKVEVTCPRCKNKFEART